MRDCLIVSHVSDSCGRKAATGDKRLPALSSSHQVGPVGYHAIVLTLLPVQPLLYLARALPNRLGPSLISITICLRATLPFLPTRRPAKLLSLPSPLRPRNHSLISSSSVNE